MLEHVQNITVYDPELNDGEGITYGPATLKAIIQLSFPQAKVDLDNLKLSIAELKGTNLPDEFIMYAVHRMASMWTNKNRKDMKDSDFGDPRTKFVIKFDEQRQDVEISIQDLMDTFTRSGKAKQNSQKVGVLVSLMEDSIQGSS